MANAPTLASRLIDRNTTFPGVWAVAGLFLLGGCQELSCELTSDIDGLAPARTEEPVPDEAEVDVEAVVEAVVDAELGPPVEVVMVRTPAEPAEASVRHADATLVHFKAFAEEGWRSTLSAKVDLRVSDAAEAERLSVHGKARCHTDGTIATSTASVQVSRLDSWDLDFFSGHDDVSFDQCQVDLRLGDDSGALYAPLGTFCYADGSTASGPCAQGLIVRTPKSSKTGLAMLSTTVEVDDGLEVDFELQPTRNAGHGLEVTGRALCKAGDERYMEQGSHSFDGGAFDFEPGEVYGGEFTVFDDDKWSELGLQEATCQLSFEATDLTLYGDEHPHGFHTACVTAGKVDVGPCEGFPAAPFSEGRGFAALEVKAVDAALSSSRYSTQKAVQFSLELAASGPVEGSLYGEVTCQTKAGLVEQDVRWDGTDPTSLRKGESAKVWLAPFGDAPDLDTLRWCQLKLTTPGSETPWAQYCWNGRRTKAGACG
ncbi:MAG: hypothetical protein KUG77_25450 [Nannocystaceae bacterium]|nr:hypothetical protein [Nannocystaceae bacterium]